MKQIILFIAALLTAQSSGFFLAWSMSVIVGTKKVGDFTYLETMQNINREILNPVFFLVFFGSLIALILNACFQYDNKATFWLAITATLFYLLGTFGVTALGNVPLNNELDVLDLDILDTVKFKQFRHYYESRWNRYHLIRTLAGLASFTTLLISIIFQKSF